jgi:tetratricopeptide (TPR) repeat protein
MNSPVRKTLNFLPLLVSFFLQGCLSVPLPEEAGASDPGAVPGISKDVIFKRVLAASTEDEVDQAVVLLKNLHVELPRDVEVLSQLSNLYIFKGAAYESKVSRKRDAYFQAMHYASAAMMLSPEFRDRIEHGEHIWDAVEVLDDTYLPAMSFWSTALFYQFDECMNKLGKPFNLRWVRRSEAVLARAYALDSDWGGGQLNFSYGIYYLMPAVAGGNMKKSEEYFSKAVEAGPDWLLNRWGRARYFYKKTGDREAQIADLEWVLEQDAFSAPGPVYWNLYCQRDAQAILNDL